MKVVFDGTALGSGPMTGVARSFANALASYGERFPGIATLLLPRHTTLPTFDGIATIVTRAGRVQRQFGLPRLLRRLGASVLHSPVAAVPLQAPCPTIATLHDVPWLHPEAEERSSRWRRFVTRASLRAAAVVIAPSAFTRRDAVALCDDATRVRHVPHGIAIPTASAVPSVRNGPFLVLGDDRPRKNRERVAAAHARARAQRPDLPPLRFVGPPHDFVDEATKSELLRTCRAVVQCSLFEGFGMPVLEALAHGAPIVCSDIAPFREIAGDTAVFVDPRDVEAIAAALLRVVTEDHAATAARQERARLFTSARTAEAWHAIHRSLVAP